MSSHAPRSTPVDRRRFLQAAAAVGAVVAADRLIPSTLAAPTAKSPAETIVTEFYSTLTESQRAKICFPFDHELRKRINANWAITEPEIVDDFYTPAQRDLVKRIMQSLTSEEGFERFTRQMDEDAGGWDRYHLAVFGEPGTGKFEFELTGRHATMRADGDSVGGYAFGGPIVYGHGETKTSANVFHYQTKQANEVFAALDPAQRERALLPTAPGEANVPLQGDGGKFPGLAVGEMSSDQQSLVEKTVRVMLAPYRAEDVEEALAILKSTGGFGKLHMAFYQQGDIDGDKVWDIFRVEGPSFVWHFRGAPHVHTYVNIGLKA